MVPGSAEMQEEGTQYRQRPWATRSAAARMLTGLTPITLWLTCLLAVRNQRILTAWDARQADDARRAAAGLPPKTRRRRRKTLASLAAAAPP